MSLVNKNIREKNKQIGGIAIAIDNKTDLYSCLDTVEQVYKIARQLYDAGIRINKKSESYKPNPNSKIRR